MKIPAWIAAATMLFIFGCRKEPPEMQQPTEPSSVQAANGSPSAASQPVPSAQPVAGAPQQAEAALPSSPDEVAELANGSVTSPEASPFGSRIPPAPGTREDRSPSCIAKVSADEEKIRQETLPLMKEVNAAKQTIFSFAERMQPLVYDMNQNSVASLRSDYFTKYDACVKELPTPKKVNEPICDAFRSANPALCYRISDMEVRASCFETAGLRQVRDGLVAWSKAGFDASWCAKPASEFDLGLWSPAWCGRLVGNEECSPAMDDELAKQICEAIAAGKSGAGCGGDRPMGSKLCSLVVFAANPDPVFACQAAIQRGEYKGTDADCQLLDKLRGADCSTIKAGDLGLPIAVSQPCLVVRAARTETGTCQDGGIPTASFPCAFLTAVRAVRDNKPELCDGMLLPVFKDACRMVAGSDPDDCPKVDWAPYNDALCRDVLLSYSLYSHFTGKAAVRIKIINLPEDDIICAVNVAVVEKDGGKFSQKIMVQARSGEDISHDTDVLANTGARISLSADCVWKKGVLPVAR